MRRIQIYITDEQDRRSAAYAADLGVPKAQVTRRMLDAGLGIDDGAEAGRRAIRATAGVLPDADDWESWLARVRGAGAAERLSPRHLRGDACAPELQLETAEEDALASVISRLRSKAGCVR